MIRVLSVALVMGAEGNRTTSQQSRELARDASPAADGPGTLVLAAGVARCSDVGLAGEEPEACGPGVPGVNDRRAGDEIVRGAIHS
jgi:hypothetical protein